jgi:hypothetical protein
MMSFVSLYFPSTASFYCQRNCWSVPVPVFLCRLLPNVATAKRQYPLLVCKIDHRKSKHVILDVSFSPSHKKAFALAFFYEALNIYYPQRVPTFYLSKLVISGGAKLLQLQHIRRTCISWHFVSAVSPVQSILRPCGDSPSFVQVGAGCSPHCFCSNATLFSPSLFVGKAKICAA